MRHLAIVFLLTVLIACDARSRIGPNIVVNLKVTTHTRSTFAEPDSDLGARNLHVDPLGPIVERAAPAQGSGGDLVAIHGANFGDIPGVVQIFADVARVLSWSDSEIIIRVPDRVSAGDEPLTVIQGGKSSLPVSFAVLPKIVSVTPSTLRPGALMSIEGTNFGSSLGKSKILIGGVASDVILYGMTHIVARVPAGVTGTTNVVAKVAHQASAESPIAISADATTPPAPTFVSITFDDTISEQLQAASYLAAAGLSATFYVNSPRIDEPGYYALADLNALYAAGFEIGGHTLDHIHLTVLDDSEKRRQVCDDRANLIALGFQPRSFAYPGGYFDADTESIVEECGYLSGRNITGGTSQIAPSDKFAIDIAGPAQPTSTLATLQNYVTRAEEKGGWVTIVFHSLCDTCPEGAIDPVSPALFDSFVDWLAPRSARGTVVRTVHEMIGGSLAAPVEGPPPPPNPPGPNILRNPSFEQDDNGDGIPDCWAIGRQGAPSYWSYSNDAEDGSVSESLSTGVSTYLYRRIMTIQDSGSCAPTITPGAIYTLRAFYRGGSRASFDAYYRDQNGFWQSWLGSPIFPANGEWEQASWTLPPAPADATAISIGILATDALDLEADAFSLELAAPFL